MAKICFDYGHGGNDPGAVYKGRKEKDDNLDVGKAVAKRLRSFGVIVNETRTTDKTLSLKERSDFEKKQACDFFISFHRNAFKAEQARGVETYTYLKSNKKATDLARSIQKALKDIGFIDRGVKRANFHVLRETKAPAILIELGFIDSSLDNEIFVKKKDKIVLAISNAILDLFGINYKVEEPKEETYYRVVSGSFKEFENAKKKVEILKEAGFEATIVTFNKKI